MASKMGVFKKTGILGKFNFGGFSSPKMKAQGELLRPVFMRCAPVCALTFSLNDISS